MTGAGPSAPPAPASLQKRSVLIAGHATSVSLETAFWEALREIAAGQGCSMNAVVESVDRERTGNLSSALRVFVLQQSRGGGNDRDAVPAAMTIGPGSR